MRALVNQKPVILKDYAQEIDSVGHEKYPIGVGLSDSLAEQRGKQGIPIAIVDPRQLREGADVNPAAGAIGVFNRAPHPNAAKLYINWLLSKEGQTSFARAAGYISSRLDVPTDHAAPWRVLQRGPSKVTVYSGATICARRSCRSSTKFSDVNRRHDGLAFSPGFFTVDHARLSI